MSYWICCALVSSYFDNVVFTSHNPAWTHSSLTLRDQWGLLLEKRASLQAKAFISLNAKALLSVYLYQSRNEQYPQNLHLIHGAIHPEKWSLSTMDGDYVLSIGKIDRRKGYHLAAKSIFFFCGATRYVVAGKSVGDTKYEEKLTKMGVELHLDPTNEEIKQYLRQAIAFIHPSEFEAFSIAVLEAMASGLPIVASPECIGQVWPNKNGFISSSPLYGRYVRMLVEDENLRKRMGAVSREIVLEHFSWPKIADKIMEVYREVLNNEQGT